MGKECGGHYGWGMLEGSLRIRGCCGSGGTKGAPVLRAAHRSVGLVGGWRSKAATLH